MRIMFTNLWGLGLILLGVLPMAAVAGPEPSGCADLSGIGEVPDVDYGLQIQPIFDASCVGCHGDGGGLSLAPGESWANLVNVDATTHPTRKRVEPFNSEQSVLLLSINCSDPGGPGFRMGKLSLEDQALVRDWIEQGALVDPNDIIFRDRFFSEP